jgi:hypothetical protein
LLTHKKGWELTAATSVPAYTNNDGVTNEDLFKSFWLGYECELDDILFFYENKSSIMDHGKELCTGQTLQTTSLGNWRFKGNEEEVLEFHLPYFYAADGSGNFALLEAKIVRLTDEKKGSEALEIRIPVEFTDDVAKGVSNLILNTRGIKGSKAVKKYDFIFTYKAK